MKGFSQQLLDQLEILTFAQILDTNNSHWVRTSSIGCLPGHVKLYDSLYDDVIRPEIAQQMNDMNEGAD